LRVNKKEKERIFVDFAAFIVSSSVVVNCYRVRLLSSPCSPTAVIVFVFYHHCVHLLSSSTHRARLLSLSCSSTNVIVFVDYRHVAKRSRTNTS